MAGSETLQITSSSSTPTIANSSGTRKPNNLQASSTFWPRMSLQTIKPRGLGRPRSQSARMAASYTHWRLRTACGCGYVAQGKPASVLIQWNFRTMQQDGRTPRNGDGRVV